MVISPKVVDAGIKVGKVIIVAALQASAVHYTSRILNAIDPVEEKVIKKKVEVTEEA